MANYTSLYLQPETQEELLKCLPELTQASVVLAGGTDLLPRLRKSSGEPDIYLSLWGIESFREITLEQGWLRIGAMVTHDKAAADPQIERYFQALKMACRRVGSQQIRNKGTLCGSIANASPAGDILPCVFLFEGEIEVAGVSGTRWVRAEDFVGGNGKIKLGCGEIITAVCLPVKDNLQSCFVKLGSRREVTIAQISMCAAWEVNRECPEKRENLRAVAGAVDVRPLPFDGKELSEAASGDEDAVLRVSQRLRNQIYDIRIKRQRESKLKLTEAEKLYKERAAKGLICDIAAAIRTGCAVECPENN